MRKVFREFYNNTLVDFSNLSREVLIIFDTNTLLNIYRYSKSTRDTFLGALKNVEDNIWIPYQIGLEFNLNRREVMKEMDNKGEKIANNIKKRIEACIKDVKRELESYPIKSIDGTKVRQEMHDIFDEKATALGNDFLENEFIKLEELIDKEEDKLIQLVEIFDDKVGESFKKEEIEAICKEGAVRFEKNIPPGYKDKNKEGLTIYNDLEFESKYGDLILWKQIIKKTKEEERKLVIFITDDHKEDWWYEINGEKIGARAELKNELSREANADLILMNTNTFLRKASQEQLKSDLIEMEAYNNKLIFHGFTKKKIDLNNQVVSNKNWIEEGIFKEDIDFSYSEISTLKRIESLKEEIEDFAEMIEILKLDKSNGLRSEIEYMIFRLENMQDYFSPDSISDITLNELYLFREEMDSIARKFREFKIFYSEIIELFKSQI